MARRKTFRENPVLGIMGNPPAHVRRGGAVMSEGVISLRYQHVEDGEFYEHEFGPGVEMIAESNGTIILRHHRRKPLWEDFPG